MTPSGGGGAAGGRLLALLAAASYGGITTLARLAYDAGAGPATLIAARCLLAGLLLGALALVLRRPLAIVRADWPAFALTSLGIFGMTVGYLGSVVFIPVSLAALIFYTFPLMVAALSPLIERRRLSRGEGLAFFVAFAGLALALGPRFDSLDPRGVGLALLAAISVVGLLFGSRRLTRRQDSLVLAAEANLLCLLLVLPFFALAAELQPPAEAQGWLPFAAACGLYVVAVATQFLAVRLTAASEVALALNLEPVVSILAAVALLGERLSGPQWAGVALVIAALALTARR